MTNWYSIVSTIASLVLGFFLGILKEKLFEKKVSLSHKLDAPAVFSLIPPKMSFQSLKISNNGKLPAKNLRINLNADLIKQHEAVFKPITEEEYKEETREGILTLKFDTLRPKEELIIAFKSSEPIPENFLVNIKSDEMLSKKESVQKGAFFEGFKYSFTMTAPIAIAAMALSMVLTLFIIRPSKPLKQPILEQPALSLSIMKDKSIYGKGENAEITYQITNLKKDMLRDIFGKLEIPGFDLNYEQKYMEKKWLESAGQITHRITFNIPKDVPSGKHKIILQVHASSLEEEFTQKAEAFFDVQ